MSRTTFAFSAAPPICAGTDKKFGDGGATSAAKGSTTHKYKNTTPTITKLTPDKLIKQKKNILTSHFSIVQNGVEQYTHAARMTSRASALLPASC